MADGSSVAVESNIRGVRNLFGLVAGYSIVFVIGAWATTPHAPGLGGSVGVGLMAVASRRDAESRAERGLPARWDSLRHLGAAKECAVWFASVAVVWTLIIGVTGWFADPWVSGLIIGTFFATLTVVWFAVHRRLEAKAAGDARSSVEA